MHVATITCHSGGNVSFSSVYLKDLYQASGHYSIKDTYKACNGLDLNKVTLGTKGVSGSVAYDYGVMAGMAKGDNLAYKITIPGDITQVWNTGNNSYKANATGEFETIEINAQIVPDKSSSMYMAQDSYTDTVTAIIAY